MTDDLVAAIVAVLADHVFWDGICWDAAGTPCDSRPYDEAEWRAHVAPLIAAVCTGGNSSADPDV